MNHLLPFLLIPCQHYVMPALFAYQPSVIISTQLRSIKCLPHGYYQQRYWNRSRRPIASVFPRSLSMKSEDSGHVVSSNFSHPSYKFNDTTIVTATSIVAASVLIASASIKCNVPHCEKESIMPFPDECITSDAYNGVSVDVSHLPNNMTSDASLFRYRLLKAVDIWKGQGKRGIWLIIPTAYSHLIPVATELNFDFQYAEKGKVVLTTWLPDTPSRLPIGPTHQVGVGALVLHPTTGKMLVVQEKSGPAAARRLWKMPTGLADPGEDIIDAVIREVREETGLDCVFDHIICFRQAHYPRKSDMFFVCQLKLAEKYDQELQQGKEIKLFPQEQEIAEAKWVDVEEYFSQPLWLSSPLYMKMNEALTKAAGRITDESKKSGFIGKRLPIGFNPGHNTIYFMGTSKGSSDEETP